jgi:hypothetical protein
MRVEFFTLAWSRTENNERMPLMRKPIVPISAAMVRLRAPQRISMNTAVFRFLFLTVSLVPLAGCGNSSAPLPPAPVPLALGNINLIFVVSDDLDYQAKGEQKHEEQPGLSLQVATAMNPLTC